MKTVKPNDVVLGYTLKTRIGSGGYGEVWSAEAPGGMAKAVKFIYGFHDEERAKTELKSLDRVKLVRHPFLLSLERIQVVSGQLVVITELGDKSLADLNREFREAQGSGIPRDELLGYLRDAADGLDYLAQQHNLQHLDIKPENLLLLGGHVKIADFGLVKELKDNTQSLMNGLTPIYAPPELFDGQPHVNSDQYSLAIVYQEMLTGVRPFNGSTAAQLAKQHIHSQPLLQALPPHDQLVIARALSKDPQLRFASCREMIDELVERKARVSANASRGPVIRREKVARKSSSEAAPKQNSTSKFSLRSALGSKSKIEWLPPLDLSTSTAVVCPTLVVGIGRAASQALQRTRQRAVQQFGPAGTMPAFGYLILDTDAASLSKLIESGTGIGPSEILPLPLKSSEQYRQADKWNWLSRRWMYNVPRSGQTEGLRPLGRLAFADHTQEIFQRLKEIAMRITQPEAVAETAEAVGLDPEPNFVRVFVVTSSAGGVGSGMTVDLSYAIRAIFDELGLDEFRLTGILAHSAPRGPDGQLLAIANSLCLLSEIRQFNRYGYPGDETCDMPRIENQRVFDETYLLHLGDGLTAAAFEEGINQVGDYVFLNMATRCQVFIEQCRAADDSELRSASLRSLGLSQHDAFDQLSLQLAEAVAQRWSDVSQAKARLTGDEGPELLRRERGLNPGQARQRAAEALAPAAQAARQYWQHNLPVLTADKDFAQTIRRVDQLAQTFSDQLKLEADRGADAASARFVTKPQEQGRQLGQELRRDLWRLVSQSKYRLGGARCVAVELIRLLGEEIEQLRQAGDGSNSQAREALEKLKASLGPQRKPAQSPSPWEQAGDPFVAASIEQCEGEFAIAFLEQVVVELNECDSALRAAADRFLPQVEQPPRNKEHTGDVASTEPFPLPQIKACLQGKLNELVDRVDTHLQHGWLHDVGGLAQVLADGAKEADLLSKKLTAASHSAIAGAQRDLSLADLAHAAGMSPSDLLAWLEQQIIDARPLLADGPGQGRALIGHAGNESAQTLLGEWASKQPVPPTIADSGCGELVICQELQNIPFAHWVHRLLAGRSDALDVVARLHSRTDVQWSSVNELFQMS